MSTAMRVKRHSHFFFDTWVAQFEPVHRWNWIYVLFVLMNGLLVVNQFFFSSDFDFYQCECESRIFVFIFNVSTGFIHFVSFGSLRMRCKRHWVIRHQKSSQTNTPTQLSLTVQFKEFYRENCVTPILYYDMSAQHRSHTHTSTAMSESKSTLSQIHTHTHMPSISTLSS